MRQIKRVRGESMFLLTRDTFLDETFLHPISPIDGKILNFHNSFDSLIHLVVLFTRKFKFRKNRYANFSFSLLETWIVSNGFVDEGCERDF